MLITGVVPSASAAKTVKMRATPSVVERAPMFDRTGVWLPASLIVKATTSLSEARPSEARNIMLYVPA